MESCQVIPQMSKFQDMNRCIVPTISWKPWISVNWGLTINSFNSEVFALGTSDGKGRGWGRLHARRHRHQGLAILNTHSSGSRRVWRRHFSVYKIHLCHVIKKWPWHFLTWTSTQSKKWLPSLFKYLKHSEKQKDTTGRKVEFDSPCQIYAVLSW